MRVADQNQHRSCSAADFLCLLLQGVIANPIGRKELNRQYAKSGMVAKPKGISPLATTPGSTTWPGTDKMTE
jgi:hypothetical protein